VTGSLKLEDHCGVCGAATPGGSCAPTALPAASGAGSLTCAVVASSPAALGKASAGVRRYGYGVWIGLVWLIGCASAHLSVG
jgi:hypothetical protein